MTTTTISSREFNQDVSAAKRAASEGPVLILDRGKPAHVLLSYREWLRIVGRQQTIGDLLHLPGAEDIKLALPARKDRPRAAKL